MAMKATFCCALLLVSTQLAAQSPHTANTLKLDDLSSRPAATLADAALLIGHWQGEFLGGTVEEIWLPPAGGTMLGLFRLTRGDEALFYEIMTVAETEGSIEMRIKHFHADLKGWEEKDEMVVFPLVMATGDALWFQGLTFQRLPDGTLQGHIALGSDDDSVTESSFTYHPVVRK